VDGYLVPARDVEAAAKYAIEILSRPDRGRAMGREARVNARKRYCSNDVIPLYEAYYEKVLNSTGAAARA
jgi:glycosyltransferase involved in cell wall biosynthesis